MDKLKASELNIGDIIYLGHGVIGKIIRIDYSITKPAYIHLFFSDGYLAEVFKDDLFEKLE